jgi:hypothetical protein
MPSISARQRALLLGATLVIAASILITTVFLIGLESNALSAASDVLWVIYLPAWVPVNGAFGGIHGAPGWSFGPSIFIAVVLENLALAWIAWKLWRLIARGSGQAHET